MKIKPSFSAELRAGELAESETKQGLGVKCRKERKWVLQPRRNDQTTDPGESRQERDWRCQRLWRRLCHALDYITQECHNSETLFILKRESHIVAQVCLRISPPVSASRVVDLHVCTITRSSATHSSSQRDFEIIHFVEESKL